MVVIMVHLVEEKDYPRIIDMGAKFISSMDLPVDKASILTMIGHLIQTGIVAIHDSGKGFIACHLFNWNLNPSKLVAQEVAWWVEPEARGEGIARELLDFYINWAKEKNAFAIEMGTFRSLDKGNLGAFYEKNGFKETYKTYTMFLGDR